ncbi:hypothetical protein CHLNCDRAFT_137297 [Chlorella variabilis]|uniref:LITAF domain-containing protein n=1 Tax=Chlorella variabilis TaxID=554065 RepID=E1ZM46_CHLVA|nr:hypothetical protein CHLNCDRAFT_137297 [Chlorella variabilis]EFN52939.1 hypothetical protein CHLNCDRAFT_137297 [Chlorella variabilis]|eukprot:XP_005845041.1 hypothetical protein CHLNCDRAFT_137297 [Chlorella variabilis]
MGAGTLPPGAPPPAVGAPGAYQPLPQAADEPGSSASAPLYPGAAPPYATVVVPGAPQPYPAHVYPAAAPPSYSSPPPLAPPVASYPPAPTGPLPPGVVLVPLSATPIAGMVMRPPRVPPQPGQVLLGYEVCRPRAGCLRCDGLSPVGLVAVIFLLMFCWPLAWVPCVIPDCFNSFQRPVYGWRPTAAGYPAHPPAAGIPQHPPHWR